MAGTFGVSWKIVVSNVQLYRMCNASDLSKSQLNELTKLDKQQ